MKKLSQVCFLKRSFKKIKIEHRCNSKRHFTVKNIETGTIMTRAFKPMPVILDLVNENFKSYKNIIMFMGSTGRKILNETLKVWDVDYEEKRSLTNEGSFILNIKKKLKKKS